MTNLARRILAPPEAWTDRECWTELSEHYRIGYPRDPRRLAEMAEDVFEHVRREQCLDSAERTRTTK